MNELPIACSLDAGDARAQLDAWRALAPWEVSREPLPDGVRVVYRREAGPALEAVAAAERACCGFLDILVEHVGESRVLTVRAPSAPLVEDVRLLGLA